MQLPVISTVADGDLPSMQTVSLDAGSAYTFTCTSAMADETPDIVWNLIDNANVADVTQLQMDPSNDSPDCVLASNVDSLTFTAVFATHHNHRLQCVTSTDAGTSSIYILLTVDSKYCILSEGKGKLLVCEHRSEHPSPSQKRYM